MDAALLSPITPPGGAQCAPCASRIPEHLVCCSPLVPLLYLSSELDLKGVCRTAVFVGPYSVLIQEAAKLRAAELSSAADVNVSFQNMFAPGFFLFQSVLIALCCHSTLHDPKITWGERRQQLFGGQHKQQSSLLYLHHTLGCTCTSIPQNKLQTPFTLHFVSNSPRKERQ